MFVFEYGSEFLLKRRPIFHILAANEITVIKIEVAQRASLKNNGAKSGDKKSPLIVFYGYCH